ncbi:AAA family ATPase [Neiella marina]|uniref:AAA family ATPase n=1 Tax=Neiella holothuriorum TaxID=2870530 RepID=A0ABS7EE18_9GAMM|nr:AAA family ATPase [Neiella holothuriorum]MBW8190596.1 AAA family ATPase [Neiella holothuriorum]
MSLLQDLIDEIEKALSGKRDAIELAVCCLLSGGHLLIEDLPGMGKTTLAQALAKALGLQFQRVQFTSDLLPSDITGVSIYSPKSEQFEFVAGPVFSQLLLADEINRATPKTQSALLEAMEERQVTVDGQTRPLPEPFFVIATQNPVFQSGTFALPESQLDRFLMRIAIGYPTAAAERQMLKGESGRIKLNEIKPPMDLASFQQLQQQAQAIHCADAIYDYVQRLVDFSRSQPSFAVGLSPRASLALLQCGRCWAMLQGRRHVLPEDIQAVLPSVVEHRLHEPNDQLGQTGSALSQQLLQRVAVVS